MAATAGFLLLYLQVAQTQSEINSDLTSSDQSAYMNFAKKAYNTNMQFTGNRNRMPLYPYLQALFYSSELSDEAFFQQGKQRNIALSLLCLLALSLLFFAKFSRLYAIYALLSIAFLVFAIKSPFFQTELLFYTIFGLAFIFSVEAILIPKWYKSVSVGVLFALAHLCKASALPGLFMFVSSYGFLVFFTLLCRNTNRADLKKLLLHNLLHSLAAILTFMVLLFPYLQESKERYGSYFYNVNTTFYMWYDSWDEAKQGTRAAGDRLGWPHLPHELIPSPSKYLQEHSAEEILGRFHSGIKRMIASGCYLKRSKYRFGYCSQVGLNLLTLAFAVALHLPKLRYWGSGRSFQIVLYIVLFHVLYALSFAWYISLSSDGSRTILSLMIPLLWTVGIMLHSPRLRSSCASICHRPIRIVTVIYTLMFTTVFYEIYQVVRFRALLMYGGK